MSCVGAGALAREDDAQVLGICNWGSAQAIVRDWEARIDGRSQTVPEAFGYFLADCVARNLKAETIAKYRLLQREMIASFTHHSIDSLRLQEISAYREMVGQLAPVSARKKIERMRTFFKFCEQRKWSDENPAVFLKPPRATFSPTLPFSSEESKKYVKRLRNPDMPKGAPTAGEGVRVAARTHRSPDHDTLYLSQR